MVQIFGLLSENEWTFKLLKDLLKVHPFSQQTISMKFQD